MKDLKIIEIMELFDEGEVIPASEMKRPQSALDREMFEDANKRLNQADGGMLVQPGFGGTRQGYKKDNPGSLYKQKNGYVVQFGDAESPNKIFKYFGPREYGSITKAKKAAQDFKKETAKTWTPGQTKTGIKQPAAEKAIQELLDEGTEITTKNILDKMPKKIVKEGVADSVLTKAKKQFKNLDFKNSPRVFLKAPKEVAAVKRLIEDGLPLKEIQAKGFSIKFIKNVAKNSELKIAETGYEYYKNIQKITEDLTKIGNNNKIKQAFEKGTVSKELLNDVAKITKSKDPFYDSRLLFKLAEYYDGTLESWYKPKILKITDNQKINANKVIQTSSIFQGGKRSGYAYQSNLYDWGAKQIDQALDLPLGTFRNIQKDIAKTLPSGISLDEVFGVKSSGRYAPIEGVLTNPLESKINVTKGEYVDNVKSAYQKQLIDAAGDPKKQKQILKEYNETISKSKVRYPDVEFPNYEVGKSPNKTIKNFGKLPPLIQKQLLDNYKKTGIAPTTKKAVNIFDIAKATDSPTFSALDKKTQVKLTSKDAKNIQNKLKTLLASFSANPKCRASFGKGGRIGYATGPAGLSECAISGRDRLEKVIKTGAKLGDQEALLARQILRAGRSLGTAFTLSGLFGPAAIAFTAAAEAGIVGYDMLTTGKTFKETIGDSLLNYALGEKTKIDPNKELLKRFGKKDNQGNFLIKGMTEDKLFNISKVLDQTNTLNTILKQDLKVNNLKDQVKAFREQPRDQFMMDEDEMLQTDQAIRAEQALKDEQKNLENLLTDYRTPLPVDTGDLGDLVGLSKEDAILSDMASGKFQDTKKDLDEAIRAAEIQKLESSGPVFMGKVFPKFEAGRQEDLLDLRSNINPAAAYAIESYENPDLNRFTPIRPFGLAGGGIAKLAGIDEGPQTVSMNPDSQGLQSLKNRVKNI